MNKVDIKILNENGKIPTQGTTDSAGFDLYSAEDYRLLAGECKLFKLGISIAVPTGYYGQIAPRSGLALRNQIAIFGGVVDEGYLGEIGVILKNFGSTPLEIKKGDRIAQFIFIKCDNKVEFNKVDDLGLSKRQDGGFGSTGK